MASMMASFTSAVARVILSVYTADTVLPKFSTPTKSLLPSVLMTLVAASLARVNRSPVMEPEVSIMRMTFLAPEVAVTYQGLNLGS